ncbi:MAG: hypothetical protein JSS49_21510 [Planctomycetes bacterium]|nr:hypothetical protein [Planctomycetota bacterium]
MPPYEPYWDIRSGPWPGLFDINGNPIKADIVYDTHLGVWCDWNECGDLGIVATDEFLFTADGRFVWRSLRNMGRKEFTVKREGMWQLVDDVLKLRIESTDEPDVMPRHRVDLKIIQRKGRLEFNMIRSDDELRNRIRWFCLLPAREGDAGQVLEAVRAKARPTVALPPPFRVLETLLGMAIPSAVKKLNLSTPVFCVRLYYHDTHAPREEFGLRVRVLTEPLRRKLAEECGDATNLADELWHPLGGVANGIPGQDVGLYEADLHGSKELTRYFGEVYDLLCESEDEYMPLLRELARRACRKLNAREWDTVTPTTDDFAAFPADGSGFFGGEYEDDLEAAVPAERIELLRERGYLA